MMKTLDEAIQERLAERRRQQEEAERRKREEAARIEQQKMQVVELFRQWMKEQLDVDLGDQEISVSSGIDHFIAEIKFDLGSVTLKRPIVLHNDKIEVVPIDKSDVWHATYPGRNSMLYVDFQNFIDAVIYAKFSSSTKAPHFKERS